MRLWFPLRCRLCARTHTYACVSQHHSLWSLSLWVFMQRRSGATFSDSKSALFRTTGRAFHGPLAEAFLHWFGSLNISLMLWFLLGVRNVVTSSLRYHHHFKVPSEPWLWDGWACYCPMAYPGRLFATPLNCRFDPKATRKVRQVLHTDVSLLSLNKVFF